MAILCLLLLLFTGVLVPGHPAALPVPVPNVHQDGVCDTLRSFQLSLQAALDLEEGGGGGTCHGVQASGEDNNDFIFYVSITYDSFITTDQCIIKSAELLKPCIHVDTIVKFCFDDAFAVSTNNIPRSITF